VRLRGWGGEGEGGELTDFVDGAVDGEGLLETTACAVECDGDGGSIVVVTGVHCGGGCRVYGFWIGGSVDGGGVCKAEEKGEKSGKSEELHCEDGYGYGFARSMI
jgi:hypothetical protein